MVAYIPSESLYQTIIIFGCEGVLAYDSHLTAGTRTSRRKNVTAKNQYFSVSIPDRETFIDADRSMTNQTPYVLHRVLDTPALSLLFTSELRGFMDRLGAFLTESGSPDNPEAAQTEISRFYDKKREQIKKTDAKSYIELITRLAKDRSPAVVASYLSQSALVTGLTFREPSSGGQTYLLFNPRRDVIIKEIVRAAIPETRLVS
jgi:hypothetical protein